MVNNSGSLGLFNRYQMDLGPRTSAPARLSYEELMSRRNAAVDNARATATRISPDLTAESLAVDAGRIGEGFRLLVDQPVSLPRQKSALLPVQHGPIGLTPISIYNRATHPRFPLLAAKIKNTTGQHLLAGPTTVTDANGYVGDCKLPNLQPNEERIISFAMDLGLEIVPEKREAVTEYGPVRLHKGTLIRHCTTTVRARYRLNNRSSKARTLLLDHPPETNHAIIGKNKPIESLNGVHRFEWKIDANKIVEEVVTEQLASDETSWLSSLTTDWIRQYAELNTTSKAVKEALLEVVKIQTRVSLANSEKSKVDTRIMVILAEQTRIRTHIEKLPSKSAAIDRLLKKFDDLEVELEKTRDLLKEKTAAHLAVEKELEAFVSKLDVK